MSFPYMNTNLIKRLAFNKQAVKRKKRQTGSEKGGFFSQGLMSFPYMNTSLTKRLVFNKQADKREKRQTGTEKGGNFHRVLCPFLI